MLLIFNSSSNFWKVPSISISIIWVSMVLRHSHRLAGALTTDSSLYICLLQWNVMQQNWPLLKRVMSFITCNKTQVLIGPRLSFLESESFLPESRPLSIRARDGPLKWLSSWLLWSMCYKPQNLDLGYHGGWEKSESWYHSFLLSQG